MLFLKLLMFLWNLLLLEEGDDKPDDADDDADDDPTGADDDDDDGDDDDDDEEIRDPKAKIKSLTEANERLARKNSKMEKRHQRETADLQKQIDDLKKTPPAKKGDKGESDEDRVARETAVRERDDAREENVELNLQLALLERDDIAVLPSARRKMILRTIVPDLLDSDPDDDEDIEDAIDEALEKLKKGDPELFKRPGSKDDEEDDDEEEPARRAPKPRTGTPRKKPPKGTIDRKQLEERFRGLRSRRVQAR
jgi:hypothetical protein